MWYKGYARIRIQHFLNLFNTMVERMDSKNLLEALMAEIIRL
jgi:hypothetical protein